MPEWVRDLNHEKHGVKCGSDKYVVNLGARTYSCRSWHLRGIPYLHSLVAIAWRNFNMDDFVHHSLMKDMFAKEYEPYIW